MIYLDTHIHTKRYSTCSQLDPKEMVMKAVELRLDGIIITEHHHLWTKKEVVQLKKDTGSSDLIILRGQEIRGYKKDGTVDGDFLAFGIEEHIEEGRLTKEIIGYIRQKGGVVIAAHPYRNQLGVGDAVYLLELDGIEVLNANHAVEDIQKAEKAAIACNLPGTGGSDAHSLVRLGMYLTAFQTKINSEEELVAEIKAGRCKPVRYTEAFPST